MSFGSITTPRFLVALLAVSALAGGLTLVQDVGAAPGPGMMGGMGAGGMYGGRHAKHRACEIGQRHRQGGKRLFGDSWKTALNAEQQMRLDQLHVNFAKTKAPLKARIEALKLDLAILATAQQPEKGVIDAKIKELVELKGQMLGAKYGYIAAQRQVLTPQQQASFDMDTIHKAMHGKKGKGGCGGH